MTVQELRDLIDAAPAPPPWTDHHPDYDVPAGHWIRGESGFPIAECFGGSSALIVAAVNALPALLDVVMAAEDLLLDDDNWRQLPDLRAALDRLGET